MLEAALFIIVAAGGLMVLMRRSQIRYRIPVEPEIPDRASVLAYGGLYSLGKPGDTPRMTAFSDLQWIPGGLALHDSKDYQLQTFYFGQVQWVSAVTMAADGVAAILLHLEVAQRWRVLELQMPDAEMVLLVRVLRKNISASKLNIGRPPAPPAGPIPVRLVDESLQGEIILGAEVTLYLLPHLLIVLDDDRIAARLNMSSIRRILAVERINNKLDALLHRNLPEGIVRLYSLHETASFALPQYRELAEELSMLSRCPIEFILQEDKTEK